MTKGWTDRTNASPSAAEALGPEAGLVASLDPVSLARAMAEVGAGLARHPFGGALAGLRYATGMAAAGAVSVARALGGQTSPPIPPPAEAAASPTRPGRATRCSSPSSRATC